MDEHPLEGVDPCAHYTLGDRVERGMACLLVHGFTGAPGDLHPLAEGLYLAGFPVEGLCLPGHCADVDALNAVTATDWYDAVIEAAIRLRERYGGLYIVNLSMGGLLALKLAAARPMLVDGMAILSAPTRLRRIWEVGLTAYRLLGCPSWLRSVPKLPSQQRSGERYLTHDASGGVYAVAAGLELDKVRRQAVDLLPRVVQPILVLHGEQDPTAPVESAAAIIRGVSSTTNRLVYFRHSHHVLSMDEERDRVVEEVVAFAEQVAAEVVIDGP